MLKSKYHTVTLPVTGVPDQLNPLLPTLLSMPVLRWRKPGAVPLGTRKLAVSTPCLHGSRLFREATQLKAGSSIGRIVWK